eukprot:412267-Pyramimonas_sp.AAC.3
MRAAIVDRQWRGHVAKSLQAKTESIDYEGLVVGSGYVPTTSQRLFWLQSRQVTLSWQPPYVRCSWNGANSLTSAGVCHTCAYKVALGHADCCIERVDAR